MICVMGLSLCGLRIETDLPLPELKTYVENCTCVEQHACRIGLYLSLKGGVLVRAGYRKQHEKTA